MSTHHTISLWPPITTDTNSKYLGSTPATLNMSTPAAQQPPLEYHHEYTMYSILVTSNHNWYLQIPNVLVIHQLPLPWIPLYTPYSIDWSVFLKIKTIGLIYKNKKMKRLSTTIMSLSLVCDSIYKTPFNSAHDQYFWNQTIGFPTKIFKLILHKTVILQQDSPYHLQQSRDPWPSLLFRYHVNLKQYLPM